MLKKTIKILMYSQRIVGRSIMNQAFRSLQYIDVFSVDSHAPTVGWDQRWEMLTHLGFGLALKSQA